MKNIITALILICLSCLADWDQVDQVTLDSINSKLSDIKSYVSPLSSSGTINLKVQSIDEKLSINNASLQDLYDGYEKYTSGSLEGHPSDSGGYRLVINDLESLGFQMVSPIDETDQFNDWIKHYSVTNYSSNVGMTGTPNAFLNHGYEFDYLQKSIISLNALGMNDDSWINNSVGLTPNYNSAKSVSAKIKNKATEITTEIPENLPNQIPDPGVLFVLNLSGVADLLVKLGIWQINPVNWVIPIKLVPSEGDYLNDFYVWWTSDAFYPRTFQICLKGLIYLFAFWWCYNHVVSSFQK